MNAPARHHGQPMKPRTACAMTLKPWWTCCSGHVRLRQLPPVPGRAIVDNFLRRRFALVLMPTRQASPSIIEMPGPLPAGTAVVEPSPLIALITQDRVGRCARRGVRAAAAAFGRKRNRGHAPPWRELQAGGLDLYVSPERLLGGDLIDRHGPAAPGPVCHRRGPLRLPVGA